MRPPAMAAPPPTSLPVAQRWLIAVASLVVVFVLDLVTGSEVSFSIFYLAPIAWIAWRGRRREGLVLAILAAVAWYVAEQQGHQQYSHVLIPFWNASVRLSFFAITVLTLDRLRTALVFADTLARHDPLTGLYNGRAFRELAERERQRKQRYGGVLSLAYLDVDDFKAINDSLGHEAGDEVLAEVARMTSAVLREVDVVARLGGDEFAVLLPTSDAEAAEAALTKVQTELEVLADTRGWPISFSIGVATFVTVPASVEVMLSRADTLMYEVKRGGKRALRQRSY